LDLFPVLLYWKNLYPNYQNPFLFLIGPDRGFIPKSPACVLGSPPAIPPLRAPSGCRVTALLQH
jgi:hypothetical protein